MVKTIEQEVTFTSHLIGRAALSPKVIKAMLTVPRHEFVPVYQRAYAYADTPLPIGHGQTISQPYMVALMTDLLELDDDHVVLEIGTGCGYQTAVLSSVCAKVFSVEIIPELSQHAEKRLLKLGYSNIEFKCGDGYYGWAEHAPYDGIVVTAAASHLPDQLIKQLKPGGRLVIPIGLAGMPQELFIVNKDINEKVSIKSVLAVSFVPLTGVNDRIGQVAPDESISEK